MTTIWNDMKQDLKWLVPVTVALLAFGFCAPADAQTTQPVYIRPSKGAPISLTLAANTPSVLLDFSAFNAAQVTVTTPGVAAVYAVDNLNQYVRFQLQVVPGINDSIHTLTSPTKDLNSGGPAQSQNGIFQLNASGLASVSIVVTPLPLSPNTGVTGLIASDQQFNRAAALYPVVIGGVSIADPNNKVVLPAGAKKLPYPVFLSTSPLDVRLGNLDSLFIGTQDLTVGNRAVAVPTVTAVAALPANTNIFVPSNSLGGGAVAPTWSRTLSVQNVGTTVVLCQASRTGDTITTSNYAVSLSAGTANDDGTGGRYTFEGLLPETIVRCGASGGAGRVAMDPR